MRSKKFYVQYENGEEWETITSYPLLIDAVISLGKNCEYHPETTHRILKVESVPVFIVEKTVEEQS